MRQRTPEKKGRRYSPPGLVPTQAMPVSPVTGKGSLAVTNRLTGLASRYRVEQARSLLRLDTLAGQFNALAIVVIMLAALAMLISFTILNNTSDNFRQSVTNSTSSIVAADNLSQALQNIDTAAANALVANRLNGSAADTVKTALSDITSNRPLFTSALFQARANSTNANETSTIDTIANTFYDYVGQLSIMQNELQQGHADTALAQYKQAHDILIGGGAGVNLINGRTPEENLRLNNWTDLQVNGTYKGLEANIAKLALINQNDLSNASKSINDAARLNLILIVGSAALVVLALGLISIRYAIITHRVLNPGYAAALVLSVAMLVLLATTLGRAQYDYNSISQNSFESINAASHARGLLVNMNGDQARMLLGTPASNGQSSGFDPKVQEDNYQKKLSLLQEQLKTAWSDSGYVPDILTSYSQQHTTVLNLYNQGSLNEAVKASLDASTSTRQAETSLNEVANLNKQQFDRSACSTIGVSQFGNSCQGQTGYLSLLQMVSLVVLPFLALLTLAGAWFTRRLF
ncbi:MAG TPA: hypothetical protein VH186_05135 [Chloroflexia bacterium]|nr:hypothetical protein [Chloroflexia bacterium]